MDLFVKLQILESFDNLYEKQVSGFPVACAKGCSVCCTRNVTLTTLEAYRIQLFFKKNSLSHMERLENAVQQNRFTPLFTINGWARMAMADMDPPEELMDPGWGPCPFLTAGMCDIYPARPFHCRCMMSESRCQPSGEAVIPEILVTINNIFLQYIENLDQGGGFGNLSDMTLFLLNDENAGIYETQPKIRMPSWMIPNSLMPGLMVPPEHRKHISTVMEGIHDIARRFF